MVFVNAVSKLIWYGMFCEKELCVLTVNRNTPIRKIADVDFIGKIFSKLKRYREKFKGQITKNRI